MNLSPIKNFVAVCRANVPVDDVLALAEKPLSVWEIWFRGKWRYQWEVLRDVKTLVREGLVVRHPPQFVDGKYGRVKTKDATYEMLPRAKAELAAWHREIDRDLDESESEDVPDPPPIRPVTTCMRPGCRELRRRGSDWCKDCGTNALFDSTKGL